MAVTKGEVRTAAFYEAGCQLDDMLEAAKADVLRYEGAITASKKLSELIGALGGHVNKDVEEGKLSLEVANVVSHYVSRAVVVAEAQTQQMTNMRQQSTGVVTGLQRGVDAMKKLHDTEAKKGDLEGVTSDPRPAGLGSLKQQRLAMAGSVPDLSPAPESTPAVEPVPEPPIVAPEPPAVSVKPNGARGRGARGRGAHA